MIVCLFGAILDGWRGNLRGQDKSRASFGHFMVGFLRVCAYGSAEICHIFASNAPFSAAFLYGTAPGAR
jgi:hypothetical protein